MDTELPKIVCTNYKLIQCLGNGGFGKTYLAENLQYPNSQYAVKHLTFSNTHEHFPKAMELFQREANSLKNLNHPQIPKFFDFLQEDQELYLVQEYIEGDTLSKELNGGTKFEQNEVIKLLIELLEILDFLHSKKIIHRDINPNNIIRRKEGDFVLIDFGLVKEFVAKTTPQSSRTQFCTFGYAPEEQKSGNARFNSDIYALGITAIVALTGLQPFDIRIEQSGEDFWKDKAEVSDQMKRVLSKMVRHNYENRYQSVQEVKKDLNTLLGSSSKIPIKIIQSSSQKVTERELFHGILIIVLTLMCVLVLVYYGIFFKKRNTEHKKQSLLVEKVILSV